MKDSESQAGELGVYFVGWVMGKEWIILRGERDPIRSLFSRVTLVAGSVVG